MLVILRAHVENIYGLSPADAHAVWDLTQQVAVGIRSAYGCEGTSIRQYNESAGDQDVWHFHVHAFPRFTGDRLYQRHADSQWVGPSEREHYARRLRNVPGLPYSFDDLITAPRLPLPSPLVEDLLRAVHDVVEACLQVRARAFGS